MTCITHICAYCRNHEFSLTTLIPNHPHMVPSPPTFHHLTSLLSQGQIWLPAAYVFTCWILLQSKLLQNYFAYIPWPKTQNLLKWTLDLLAVPAPQSCPGQRVEYSQILCSQITWISVFSFFLSMLMEFIWNTIRFTCFSLFSVLVFPPFPTSLIWFGLFLNI